MLLVAASKVTYMCNGTPFMKVLHANHVSLKDWFILPFQQLRRIFHSLISCGFNHRISVTGLWYQFEIAGYVSASVLITYNSWPAFFFNGKPCCYVFLLMQWINTCKLQGIEYFAWKIQRPRSVGLPVFAHCLLFLVSLGLRNSVLFSNLIVNNALTGFEILAFPCNQFLSQEPGNGKQIQEAVCTLFKAEFPIFDKVWRSRLNSHLEDFKSFGSLFFSLKFSLVKHLT